MTTTTAAAVWLDIGFKLLCPSYSPTTTFHILVEILLVFVWNKMLARWTLANVIYDRDYATLPTLRSSRMKNANENEVLCMMFFRCGFRSRCGWRSGAGRHGWRNALPSGNVWRLYKVRLASTLHQFTWMCLCQLMVNVCAVSISALQWLCNADKRTHSPPKRLYRFFSTLYSSLVSTHFISAPSLNIWPFFSLWSCCFL